MNLQIPFFNWKRNIQDLNELYYVGPFVISLKFDSKKVFPPSETSLTMIETLLMYGGKSLLDVGTGTGILAIVGSKIGIKRVDAVDINPSAIEYSKINCELNNVRNINLIHADFTSIDRKYDLVVTNPPFMPIPKNFSFISKEIMQAIDGGTDGIDQQVFFLKNIRKKLSPSGKLLFPVPEFGDFKTIIKLLKENYDIKLVARKTIRYWLAEYNHEFVKHIKYLSGKNKNVIKIINNLVLTNLNIFECSLK